MDQSQTLESENLLAGIEDFFSDDRPQRFLIGFLIAVAFFFIAAGVAEILLANNEACVEALSTFRVAPDPNEVCMSEFGIIMARGFSRGVLGAVSPNTSPLVLWLLTALLYGVIGGGLGQFSLRWAIAGFAAVLAVVLMISMTVSFMSQFIVFN